MNIQNPLPSKFAEIRFDQFKSIEFTQYAAKYVYIYLCVIFLTVVLFIAYTDNKAATVNYYYYLAFLVLPLLLIFYIISPLFSQNLSSEQSIVIGTWGLAILIATFIFFKNRSSSNVNLANQSLKVVFALGLVVGLSLIYKMFARSINNMRGWTGLFLQFIFFLPCLLIDFIEYILGDIASTPRVILVLFVVELLVMLAYYYLPHLFSQINGITEKKQVLKEPIFINKETVIADNNRLVIDPTRKDIPMNKSTSERVFSRNYSIIAWINITPHPNNNIAYSTETNILRYGAHNRKHGKPAIVYNGKSANADKQNILIYLSDKIDVANPSTIEIEIGGQKWNQIAIIYDNNTASVYLNGELEKIKTLASNELPSFSEYDLLIAGSGSEKTPTGLHGAICNVSFYDTPISKETVSTMYNLYFMRNPPF